MPESRTRANSEPCAGPSVNRISGRCSVPPRSDGGTHPRGLLSFISCSFLCLKVGRVPIQSLVRGRALTVFQVGALSHLDLMAALTRGVSLVSSRAPFYA